MSAISVAPSELTALSAVLARAMPSFDGTEQRIAVAIYQELARGEPVSMARLATRLEEQVPVPRPERVGDPPPRWIPLAEVPNLPIWPKQVKDLCRRLAEGRPPVECVSFVGHLESPYARTGHDPFEG